MLTKRQNMLETIRGGHPDRFVNGHEALAMIRTTPYGKQFPRPVRGGEPLKNGWGVTIQYPADAPGPFPVHDEAHIVLKDIENWRDYVKAPELNYTEADWAEAAAQAAAIDRNEYFATVMIAPGVFEQCHYLMSMVEALVAFCTNPDEMHELIDCITEFELKYAEQICKYVKPDAILHHDDWGSLQKSFLSPEMFAEFIVPAFKKIYGYYKAHGVELIIHHSDSYAANLVPAMIEMGIDVWQGPASTNNIKELIEKYGEKITFMGEVDNTVVDIEGWSDEISYNQVKKVCEKNGMKYFIPCILGGTCNKGVAESVLRAVQRYNTERFGIC